jgi:hypothetical protein|tara:strand:- start:77 stop:307 length:231 start_codon:yes stop_codon:yes gene_type:complete
MPPAERRIEVGSDLNPLQPVKLSEFSKATPRNSKFEGSIVARSIGPPRQETRTANPMISPQHVKIQLKYELAGQDE